MRIATIYLQGKETGAIIVNDHVYVLEAINDQLGLDWKINVFDLINDDGLKQLRKALIPFLALDQSL